MRTGSWLARETLWSPERCCVVDTHASFASQVEANQWKPLTLPCVIMFKNGVELLRLPPFDEKGNMIATLMTYNGCAKYFGLEKRLKGATEGDGKKTEKPKKKKKKNASKAKEE